MTLKQHPAYLLWWYYEWEERGAGATQHDTLISVFSSIFLTPVFMRDVIISEDISKDFKPAEKKKLVRKLPQGGIKRLVWFNVEE